MKHSKLLKSAILSAALLSMGAAQAQTMNGDTKLTITNPPLVMTASEMNFGSHTRIAATGVVTMVCQSGGTALVSIAPAGDTVATGTCGAVTISTTSSESVGFTVSVTSTALSTTGSGADLVAPTLVMYGSGGSVEAPGLTGAISGTPYNVWVGGTVNLAANQAAGEYSGTYTFTAAIQ